jgi:GNAT superfamily N-acetyltransferase
MDKGSLNFEVRVAGRDDDITVARLRSLWTGVDPDAVFEKRLSDWLVSEGDRRTTWLAWVGQDAIGMASLFEYRRMPRPGREESRWGYLSNMFVRNEFRNQGVGSALLSAIVALADERAYARVVLSPSERAVPFYQRAGFVVPDYPTVGDPLLVRAEPGPRRRRSAEHG